MGNNIFHITESRLDNVIFDDKILSIVSENDFFEVLYLSASYREWEFVDIQKVIKDWMGSVEYEKLFIEREYDNSGNVDKAVLERIFGDGEDQIPRTDVGDWKYLQGENSLSKRKTLIDEGFVPKREVCNGLYKTDDYIFRLKLSIDFCSIRFYYKIGNEDVLEMITDLKDSIDEFCNRDVDENMIDINIMFWNGSSARKRFSTIECPRWKTIRNNYSSQIKGRLDDLMSGEITVDRGKIFIFYGPTGTGKTFFIRSLLLQNKHKYSTFVISDPNRFLEHTNYYLRCIEDAGSESIIFLLEDSADSLLTEERKFRGHRISKLLNLTDGVLGQGRNDLFFFTFNESLEDIDPAVKRPGRCQTMIEFPKLTADEAEKWLEKYDIRKNITTKKSLAELYSEVYGSGHIDTFKKDSKQMGF